MAVQPMLAKVNDDGVFDEVGILTCTNSGTAFGPLIEGGNYRRVPYPGEYSDDEDVPEVIVEHLDGQEVAERFCEWLFNDPRRYEPNELIRKYGLFRDEHFTVPDDH